MVDWLDSVQKCSYEKARTKVRSVVYNVIKQVLFDLLGGKEINEILNKHITKYIDTRGPADKVGENILCTNGVMAPTDVLIQLRNIKTVAEERVAKRREKPLKLADAVLNT